MNDETRAGAGATEDQTPSASPAKESRRERTDGETSVASTADQPAGADAPTPPTSTVQPSTDEHAPPPTAAPTAIDAPPAIAPTLGPATVATSTASDAPDLAQALDQLTARRHTEHDGTATRALIAATRPLLHRFRAWWTPPRITLPAVTLGFFLLVAVLPSRSGQHLEVRLVPDSVRAGAPAPSVALSREVGSVRVDLDLDGKLARTDYRVVVSRGATELWRGEATAASPGIMRIEVPAMQLRDGTHLVRLEADHQLVAEYTLAVER